jgi:hypothetical protein
MGELVIYPKLHHPWIIYQKFTVHWQNTQQGLESKIRISRTLTEAVHKAFSLWDGIHLLTNLMYQRAFCYQQLMIYYLFFFVYRDWTLTTYAMYTNRKSETTDPWLDLKADR